MTAVLGGIGITSGWLPVVVDGLAVVLLAVAVIRRPSWRRVLVLLAAAVAGAAAGLLACWVCSDLLDLFEVSLSPVSRAWVATAFAAVAMAAVQLGRPGALRRAAAVAAIPLALVAGGLGVNADFGQYTTIGSLWDAAAAAALPASVAAAQRAGAPGLAPDVPAADGHGGTPATPLWSRPVEAGMPRHGIVARVTIPATVSHVTARAGYVYLPPAALVADPPRLPVLIMMSGQPGGPDDVVRAGRLAAIMDARAAADHGLAPVVVVPDQLGAPGRNPMCVDSAALGRWATYLTVDVPDWIRTHLAVEPAPGAWAIGGYSQGGTCSIQLGAGHPELFSAIFDVSGQLAPKNGSLQNTIAVGFGGDAARYRAALPATLLAAHAPYRDVVAVVGSGQFDTKYGAIADQVAAAARAAGIATTRRIAPGSAHDWHTVQWLMTNAFDPIARHLGLERP
jgi:S-formylglutathione hydrolase FrmB